MTRFGIPDGGNDDELRERFAELRADDVRRAPPFDRMWRAPRPKRSPWAVVAPVVSAAAAAAALLLWCHTQQASESAPMSAAASSAVAPPPAPPPGDPAPLDFLLDVHASLATVPDFDKSLLQGRHR